MALITQKEFFEKYNIKEAEFRQSGCDWKSLLKIYDDYNAIYKEDYDNLMLDAKYISDKLMLLGKVHSVRYRVKDPEHLIEKIIRKKIRDKKFRVSANNYRERITDIIGIRALHLYKDDWLPIHDYILQTWPSNLKPEAKVRVGDNQEYIDMFENNGCKVERHKAGYRSVHYLVEGKNQEIKFGEIQVRTIFEEGWSEIDHLIRYPYDIDNELFGEYLSIFNRLAGSADEMGSFIKNLKKVDASYKDQIKSLKEQISKVKNIKQRSKLNKQVNKLAKANPSREIIEFNTSKMFFSKK